MTIIFNPQDADYSKPQPNYKKDLTEALKDLLLSKRTFTQEELNTELQKSKGG